MPPLLLKNVPQLVLKGVGKVKWNQPKSVFLKCVLKPDYCYNQVEAKELKTENEKDQSYIPSEIKWFIIKNYFIPNFKSQTPFNSDKLKTQLWRMKKGIIAVSTLVYLCPFVC